MCSPTVLLADDKELPVERCLAPPRHPCPQRQGYRVEADGQSSLRHLWLQCNREIRAIPLPTGRGRHRPERRPPKHKESALDHL